MTTNNRNKIKNLLHLSPDPVYLVECYQVMEGQTTLRPNLLQPLLEQCGSVKVKRLFHYMAEKTGHDWFKRLDTVKFDLGAGARTVWSLRFPLRLDGAGEVGKFILT